MALTELCESALRSDGGGARSLYVSDPAGNIVEACDHFERDRTIDDLKAA